MKKIFVILFVLGCFAFSKAQTKVSGKIVTTDGLPVPYANVLFSNSTEGTISDEEGKFYLESKKTYRAVEFSFTGFKTVKIPLKSSSNLDMKVTMEEDVEELSAVNIYRGKTSKKNNPAIDILRKIWKHRRHNGIHQYDQYQYDQYEKIEFDINHVDSAMINGKLFKGMRFVFDYADTSAVTGVKFLPIYLTETASKIYGDNVLDKEKTILEGNKNPPGFRTNHAVTDFIKQLYADYDIYDNYLKIFHQSFVSPLSRTGIQAYNYVLADSAFIGKKWCYNIVYYPRRKNEMTFKGNFWVNDTTWAITKMDMAMSQKANINWVNEVYIQQEYDVLNDSTFVLTKDHFMTNFALHKKDSVYGVYGNRTTLYGNYKFNQKKPDKFYRKKRQLLDKNVFNRPPEFWKKNRLENLSGNEEGVYKMLDTLQRNPSFRRLYNLGSILASGYVNFHNFDFGPLPSIIGQNSIEGFRLRLGGRTFFSPNDMWRIQAYTAYGFKDHKFKYGISGKWMVDPRSRLKLKAGTKRDYRQLGASLTNTNNLLEQDLASSSIFTTGSNRTLTNVNLTEVGVEISPFENFKINLNGSFQTLKSADPNVFNIDYFTDPSHNELRSEVKQSELALTLQYMPGRKVTNYGVERIVVNPQRYTDIFIKYTKGIKGPFNSQFNFDRLQLFYRQPILIGGIGEFTSTLEVGKTFGEVPLSLLNIVPANQTVFTIHNAFPLLKYYEFVTDEYASLHLEHNFGGRIFSRIPLLRALNLREIIGIEGVIGEVSDKNQAMNASSTFPVLQAPNHGPYWEWHVGVGNIFRLLRIDFHFRGSNYQHMPNSRRFGVTGNVVINF